MKHTTGYYYSLLLMLKLRYNRFDIFVITFLFVIETELVHPVNAMLKLHKKLL